MRWLAVLLGVLLVGWAAPVRASGDYGCTSTWKLTGREMTGCDSRLVLGPGNDTRANLFLLLRDRHHAKVQPPATPEGPLQPHFEWTAFRDAWQPPAPPTDDFLTGEGSRCRSNDAGKVGFAAAVRAARGLTDAERTALVVARNAFTPNCATGEAMLAPVTPTLAKPWANYLRAAAAFYGADFDGAGAAFAALSRATDPWLAETARYMTARVELNRAQVSAYNDYGEPDFAKVDRAILARAQVTFDRYIAAYPNGRYTRSARGLLRRVWWLGGDTARLAAGYSAAIAQPEAARGLGDIELAQEVDYKLRPDTLDAVTDPLLLATFDLARMRDEEPKLTAAELTRQRPSFARELALYDYLQAAFAFYVENRPAEVLRLIPDATRERNMGPVALSRQVLRGQALDALLDANAGGFWRELLPAAAEQMQRAVVELGLALHEERAGYVDALLAPGSPLTTPTFREVLLSTVADAAMLRRAARSVDVPRHERDVALFNLLYKELTRGAYAAFLQDLSLVPADAPTAPDFYGALADAPHPPLGLFTRTRDLGDLGCPPPRAIATTLAANPGDPHARLCVADFVQSSGFDGGALDARPPANELGGTRALFAGRPYQRAAVFRELLASPATPPDDKAYALYRSVRCYAPGGSSDCGDDVPVTQRKAWFQRLKRDYPHSRWAQRANLYW